MDTATRLLVNHNLDPNEWEHYLTSMSDDGDSVFVYDNDAGDTLRIYPVGSRHEIKRAIVEPPASTAEAVARIARSAS